MSESPTYDRFILKTIMPSDGWQSVFYDDGQGQHSLVPIYALALAYRVTYACYTNRLIHDVSREPQDENWEIVGLDYDPDGGWTVCDTLGNYCGLLAPGMALAHFDEVSICRFRHVPQAVMP